MCHFVDLVNYLVGQSCSSVYARFMAADTQLDDSMVAILSYPDGSTCTLDYVAHADPKLPKERFEVSGEGKTASCSNYRVTELSGQRRFRSLSQDKGQATQVREVVEAVQRGEPSPFTVAEIVNVSRVTFAMLDSAATGAAVSVEP
jgi:predicted dehydrogenase